MTTERLAKIQKALEEVEEHGRGEVTIKFDEDNKAMLIVHKDHQHPDIYRVDAILKEVVDWGFGGMTVADSEVMVIREKRMEKI